MNTYQLQKKLDKIVLAKLSEREIIMNANKRILIHRLSIPKIDNWNPIYNDVLRFAKIYNVKLNVERSKRSIETYVEKLTSNQIIFIIIELIIQLKELNAEYDINKILILINILQKKEVCS